MNPTPTPTPPVAVLHTGTDRQSGRHLVITRCGSVIIRHDRLTDAQRDAVLADPLTAHLTRRRTAR